MKKTVLISAVLAAMASSASWAQSTVKLYGIVDLAARYTTHSGATAATQDQGLKTLAPGGMSQSRLGLDISEDLGGGVKALVNMEHRFNSDIGTVAAADFWRQSWVGLQGGFGRVTLGRQYNVLFNVVTSTYASFKYSPYVEAFKPEIGMSLGARNDNMIKYWVESGPVQAAFQVSAGEASATGGKSMGGYVRYADGPIALGGAYMVLQDGLANKAKAMTAGGSYTAGIFSMSIGWARNSFGSDFNPAIVASLLGNGGVNGTFALGNVDHRDMVSVGAAVQATPQFNLGVNYWGAKQTGKTSAGNGTAGFAAMVADYALSKRTDLYVEVDYTKFKDGLTFSNGATMRTGSMLGLRHRF